MQKKPYRAEGGGFEPPESCPSTVFKTVAFVRSATPPGKRKETTGPVVGSETAEADRRRSQAEP